MKRPEEDAPYRRELGNGLVLKTAASEEDIDRIAECHGIVFEDEVGSIDLLLDGKLDGVESEGTTIFSERGWIHSDSTGNMGGVIPTFDGYRTLTMVQSGTLTVNSYSYETEGPLSDSPHDWCFEATFSKTSACDEMDGELRLVGASTVDLTFDGLTGQCDGCGTVVIDGGESEDLCGFFGMDTDTDTGL